MRWPWWRREPRPDERVEQARSEAEGQLQRAQEQGPRVEEVVRQAEGVLARSGRFTREVDKALKLREV